ncbi:hypothetical protein NB640_11970 [Oxalobacter vibrioformis]|uniref:Autotransporter domain-containing protein n=1 Tax=Oxalobacter vibrioformis TaxID=933080 RepID=A0A9E9LUL1_9BURK|nr:hypothetical protein [Oxalobacter vibrioformis]WAW09920.1 hypothetical protein NB640_11970 [Oxalobacter vibrioformis]
MVRQSQWFFPKKPARKTCFRTRAVSSVFSGALSRQPHPENRVIYPCNGTTGQTTTRQGETLLPTQKNASHAGLAYEFKFDGKAGGRVHGYNLKETDMGGSTFVGELGLTWVPASMRNASLDLALEGFAGERDGFMGNVRFNYRF